MVEVTIANVFDEAAGQKDRQTLTFNVISQSTPDLQSPEIPPCPPTSMLVFSSLPLAADWSAVSLIIYSCVSFLSFRVFLSLLYFKPLLPISSFCVHPLLSSPLSLCCPVPLSCPSPLLCPPVSPRQPGCQMCFCSRESLLFSLSLTLSIIYAPFI